MISKNVASFSALTSAATQVDDALNSVSFLLIFVSCFSVKIQFFQIATLLDRCVALALPPRYCNRPNSGMCSNRAPTFVVVRSAHYVSGVVIDLQQQQQQLSSGTHALFRNSAHASTLAVRIVCWSILTD
jgi:hypothetical protein